MKDGPFCSRERCEAAASDCLSAKLKVNNFAAFMIDNLFAEQRLLRAVCVLYELLQSQG